MYIFTKLFGLLRHKNYAQNLHKIYLEYEVSNSEFKDNNKKLEDAVALKYILF